MLAGRWPLGGQIPGSPAGARAAGFPRPPASPFGWFLWPGGPVPHGRKRGSRRARGGAERGAAKPAIRHPDSVARAALPEHDESPGTRTAGRSRRKSEVQNVVSQISLAPRPPPARPTGRHGSAFRGRRTSPGPRNAPAKFGPSRPPGREPGLRALGPPCARTAAQATVRKFEPQNVVSQISLAPRPPLARPTGRHGSASRGRRTPQGCEMVPPSSGPAACPVGSPGYLHCALRSPASEPCGQPTGREVAQDVRDDFVQNAAGRPETTFLDPRGPQNRLHDLPGTSPSTRHGGSCAGRAGGCLRGRPAQR